MLTIQNFENRLDSILLERGKNYYEEGTVLTIEESGDGIWEAEVEGRENYSVTIGIKNNKQIISSSCDCPYDSDICKHVIAVLYAIKEEVEGQAARPIKKPRKLSFEDLLQKVKLKEYQEFILHQASIDKKFKTEFELYFSDKDHAIDSSKKYSDLIRKIVSRYADRGFVDYSASFKVSNEIDKLLTTGTTFMRKSNFRDAFNLSKAVLKEGIEIITYCDDSSGNIGGSIDGTIQLIETIIKDERAAIALKEDIFVFLQNELQNDIYFNYGDFGYDLFTLFRQLAVVVGKADIFTAFIDNILLEIGDRRDNYKRNFFQREKIVFLRSIGKEKEAKVLILQNLDIVEVRKAEVEKAISNKKFSDAKQLINDGITIAEKQQHPGTIMEWEKELLRIARLERDGDTIRYYTKKFAFDRWFNKEYYNQWKATFAKSEWKEVIEVVIQEKIKKIVDDKRAFIYSFGSPLLSSLAPIYIEEGYWDRLLELVKNETRLDTILTYHDHLVKIYPSEMLQVYLPALEHKGHSVNDRSGYIDLVSKMRKIIKDIPSGKEEVISTAKKLKRTYPRRPAMIEELDKILKLSHG